MKDQSSVFVRPKWTNVLKATEPGQWGNRVVHPTPKGRNLRTMQ